MEYKLVYGRDNADLTKNVNRLLADKWELFGPPFAGSVGTDHGQYTHLYQAMTLKTKKRPSIAKVPR